MLAQHSVTYIFLASAGSIVESWLGGMKYTRYLLERCDLGIVKSKEWRNFMFGFRRHSFRRRMAARASLKRHFIHRLFRILFRRW